MKAQSSLRRTCSFLFRFLIILVIGLFAVALPYRVPAAAEEFTFVVTSDMQGHSGSGAHDIPKYFRGVCEKIAALGEGAFMVSPGDLDPPSDVKWTIERYLGPNYLWYPVVGNHDAETADEMAWLRSYNYDSNGPTPPNIANSGPTNCAETTYSFDYGNSHFVVINEYFSGNSDTGTDGDVVNALYNWLVADLNSTDKAHIFVFGHEPAFPQPDADNGVLRYLGDSLDKYPVNRDRFWNLLKNRNVVAYFCGHTNEYNVVKIDGVWQVNSGHSQGIGYTETQSTFIVVHVDGDSVTFDTYRDMYNGGPYTLAHSGTLVTTGGPLPLPAAPSNLTATAVSGTQICLSWDDNSSDELGFKIECKEGVSGTYAEILSTSSDETNYTDTGLSPGITYYYRIRAYNANGNSAYSNEASAAVQSPFDVGADAIDRPSTGGAGSTLIALDNPATADGEITTVEIWAASNITGCRVGTFFSVGGSTYQCRDSQSIGNVTAGSKQTFTDLSIAVKPGDLIGMYFSGGRIERSTSGYGSLWQRAEEYIDPEDSTTYNLLAGNAISLHGTGTTGGETPPLTAITISLEDIDSATTIPSGNFRWLDIADQPYSESFRNSYNYTQANVEVNYEIVVNRIRGTLIAVNLKPNFAYQLKLAGKPETDADANERIGLAGRWWQEEWDGTTWTNGHNLNNKGDGSSPNPNDAVYFANRNITDPTSPTGLQYRYIGYLVFDYFITDEDGNATLEFETNSSYHVLWKTIQRSRTASDGPPKTATFDADPSLSPAYDIDYNEATVSIFGEWERLPVGEIFPEIDNDFVAQMVLTEESFHSNGSPYPGSWAAAMSAEFRH